MTGLNVLFEDRCPNFCENKDVECHMCVNYSRFERLRNGR